MDKSLRPRGYWTLESLSVEALKYTSRSEFQKESGSAYNAAGRLKVRDLVCAHMSESKKPNGYWTLESLQAEALKYSSRQEFQKNNASAYKAAGEQKCRDQICGHMKQMKQPKGYWTLENLHAEALKYDNKVDFRTHSNPAFLTASRKKLLDQICSHMEPGKLPNGYWLIKENCAVEALKYSNRRAFSIANSSAYHGADSSGWLDEICGHMDFNPSSDSDVVYIWRAIGHEYNKLPVYKFGTTSARLNDRRVTEVAKSADMQFEIILLTQVKVHAVELENELLKLGANPQYSGFNGASEFRALTVEELKTAIALIHKHCASEP